MERPIPEVEGIGQYVGLTAKCELLVLVSFAGVIKRITQAALNTATGVHAFLNSNFVRSAFKNEPAGTGVQAFVVFSNNDEIHILRLLVFQRAKSFVE